MSASMIFFDAVNFSAEQSVTQYFGTIACLVYMHFTFVKVFRSEDGQVLPLEIHLHGNVDE